jgi:uncharacterized protein with ATP-grasp and redox domains
MRNSTDVIAEVVNGKGPELALVLEVSKSRCYEILSTDNPYPKAKRLIRAIAQIVDARSIAVIKADLDAMFDELLCDGDCITTAELTRELFEGGQSVVEEKPIAEQKKELRETIAAASRRLRDLEHDNKLHSPTRAVVRELPTVANRRKLA